MITGFYAGLLGLMLVVLILRIVKRRWKYKVGIGDGGIPDLAQAIRVHGNFTETVPLLLILLALMEFADTAVWALHIYGVLILISRLLHAYGITSTPLHSKARFSGIILTLSLLIGGSLFLIINYLTNMP